MLDRSNGHSAITMSASERKHLNCSTSIVIDSSPKPETEVSKCCYFLNCNKYKVSEMMSMPCILVPK